MDEGLDLWEAHVHYYALKYLTLQNCPIPVILPVGKLSVLHFVILVTIEKEGLKGLRSP
jgi:hypothetical protein